MSTLINPYLPLADHRPPDDDVHLEVPTLLEYRSEEDPDCDFIPKTVAGFAMGALTMGVCLDLAETMLSSHSLSAQIFTVDALIRYAFMCGITGVSTSLLLVGLKVRAERSPEPLYARHWLNSLGTGSGYALLVWLPWVLQNHSLKMNPFVGVLLLFILSAVPVIAARWTIGPHPHLMFDPALNSPAAPPASAALSPSAS